MCRLMSGHAESLDQITPQAMLNAMKELERQQGGAGNGLAGIVKQGEGYAVKRLRGVDLTCEEIVEALYQWKPVLWQFHTRLVSSGWRCDEQCHPHYCYDADGELRGFLMQNGTVGADRIAFLKSLFGGSMDTEIVANSIYKIDRPLKDVLEATQSAIWVVSNTLETLAVNANKWNGDLVFYPKLKLICSIPLFNDISKRNVKIYSGGWVKISIDGKTKSGAGTDKTFSLSTQKPLASWAAIGEDEDGGDLDEAGGLPAADETPAALPTSAFGYNVYSKANRRLNRGPVSSEIARKMLAEKNGKAEYASTANFLSIILRDPKRYYVFSKAWRLLAVCDNYGDVTKIAYGVGEIRVEGRVTTSIKPTGSWAKK